MEIAIRIPMSGDRFPIEAVYDQAAAEIGEHLSEGRDVAILCEGDPFFYGSFMAISGIFRALRFHSPKLDFSDIN